MFTDIIRLKVKAGNGGNGHTSFRHEKFVINGGPDGGNGGNGGSIILKGDHGLNNLYRLTSLNYIKAENGSPGRGANKYGAYGKDYYLTVPFGVIVKDTMNNYLGEVTPATPLLVVAHGGRGGRGNASFKSNRNQAPDYAEPGKLGEEREIIIELKTIADIALIGMPNAGKSSLLKIITNANPKIANYPFTTLNPNLGVLKHYEDYYTLADIPGLIEGASTGLGLGFKFLRHIERCPVFLHLVDITSSDPYGDYLKITQELIAYDEKMAKRPTIIFLNKLDLLTDMQKLVQIKTQFKDLDYVIGSNFDRSFIQKLTAKIITHIKTAPEVILENAIPQAIVTPDKRLYTITKENNIYYLKGAMIYNLFYRVDFNKPDQVLRFSYQLRSLGVEDELIRQGAVDGDTIDILGYEFIFEH